ncbi:MAG: hypothetical protein WAV00_02745 [Nocardioides sp.]
MEALRDWLLRVLGAVGLALIVVTTTARLTLLDPGFDARAVAEVDGYQRVYTELLPSPVVQETIRRELSGLPLDPTYITADLRLLVPPPVLEAMVRQAIAEYLAVVLGRDDRMDLAQVVQPVVDRLVLLIHELAPGAVATAPRVHASSLEAFDARATALLSRLAKGRAGPRLPTVRLTPHDAPRVADVLTAGLPSGTATRLRHRLVAQLAAGDLSAAFALVVPEYLDNAGSRRIGVRMQAAATRAVGTISTGAATDGPRRVLPLGLGWLAGIGVLLLSAWLLPVLRRPRGGRGREVALLLTTGAVVTAGTGFVIAQRLKDPLASLASRSALDPSARRLLGDLDHQLRHGVLTMFLALLVPVALSAGVAFLAPTLRRSAASSWQPWTATVATAALGMALVVAVAVSGTRPPLVCNGSTALCDRRYDQVTYLTAHNAMASTDRGFLAAEQDPSITAQLDNGVRGLMLDLHYWTSPAEATPYLATLDARTRAAWAPLLRNFRPRPGVWLCHALCQIGADNAVRQLEQLRGWLSDNPHEVVTLILQDDVAPDDVRASLSEAGLDPWLATPPAAGSAWPTLRELINAHHTLLVFTQSADFPEGPIRNFYSVAAETPYQARTADDLSCEPGRGPATAPLFLVNNWLSRGVARRGDALEVNSRSFLLSRVRRCEAMRGMRATFVAVNFAQVGRPLATVDRLNRLRSPLPVRLVESGP